MNGFDTAVEGLSRDHISSAAAVVRDDRPLETAPCGVDPSEEATLDVHQSPW